MKRIQLLTLIITLALCTAISSQLLAANAANRISISDLSGKPHQIPDSIKKATALFFIAHDCPIANSYAPEISRIVEHYQHNGIVFYVVYAEPGLSVASARKHAADYAFKCPALRDTQHRLVKLAHAVATPEAIVLDANGKTLYRGAIDDKYVDFGKSRQTPRRQYLRDALDSIITGKTIKIAATSPFGCAIQD